MAIPFDQQQKNFSSFFNKEGKSFKEIFDFIDYRKESVGVTIVFEYPPEIKFIPVKNEKGGNDSVIFIQIYYHIQDINKENGLVPLFVSVSKESRYYSILRKYELNPKCPDSPTELSMIESKQSLQPVNFITKTKYSFNINERYICESKKTSPEKLDELLASLKKMHLEIIPEPVLFPICRFLINKIFYIVDWVEFCVVPFLDKLLNIKEERTSTDKPKTNTKDTPKVTVHLGSIDIPVDPITIIITPIFLVFIYFMGYYFNIDFLGILKFIKYMSKNIFSETSFYIFIFIVSDFITYFIIKKGYVYIAKTIIDIKSLLIIWEYNCGNKNKALKSLMGKQ